MEEKITPQPAGAQAPPIPADGNIPAETAAPEIPTTSLSQVRTFYSDAEGVKSGSSELFGPQDTGAKKVVKKKGTILSKFKRLFASRKKAPTEPTEKLNITSARVEGNTPLKKAQPKVKEEYIPYEPKVSGAKTLGKKPQATPPQSLADLKSRPGYKSAADRNTAPVKRKGFITKKEALRQKNIFDTVLSFATPNTSDDKQSLTQLHTYTHDLSDTIKSGNKSVISIAAEEQRKKGGDKNVMRFGTIPEEKSRVGLVIAGLVLILIGAGLIWGGLIWFQDAKALPDVFSTGALLSPDDDREIIASSITQTEFQTILEQTTLSDNSFLHLYITDSARLGEMTHKRLISAEQFITFFAPETPALLLRAINVEFMYGIHKVLRNEPVLILKTDAFEQTFAGMLEWEQTLREDLVPLFGEVKPFVREVVIPAAVTEGDEETASSTPTLPQTIEEIITIDTRMFTDAVIRNRDARVLYDPAGKIIFLYALPDAETLIITTNEHSFIEIIERMAASKFVR